MYIIYRPAKGHKQGMPKKLHSQITNCSEAYIWDGRDFATVAEGLRHIQDCHGSQHSIEDLPGRRTTKRRMPAARVYVEKIESTTPWRCVFFFFWRFSMIFNRFSMFSLHSPIWYTSLVPIACCPFTMILSTDFLIKLLNT